MFDIGFFELLVIGVVALVVLGPERLPRAARMAGLWVRKARAQWYSVKAEFERELAAEDMRRSIGDPGRALRDELGETGRALKQSLDEAARAAGPDRSGSPVPAGTGSAAPAPVEHGTVGPGEPDRADRDAGAVNRDAASGPDATGPDAAGQAAAEHGDGPGPRREPPAP
ncbi:Sec-independent protein translocase protein TatB [Arenimonas fontis]|uniref:Sec-independent protein translocase protein TatB n=1 Tax=Arenimonas fontis TaxID=2608255 RepID=UPI001FE4A2CB|nr:Sec-independent protein translocase protein TatB [Arenimonas fontis]